MERNPRRNPHETRHDTGDRPMSETPDPLEEKSRREEDLARGQRDEFKGPGPARSPQADETRTEEAYRAGLAAAGGETPSGREAFRATGRRGEIGEETRASVPPQRDTEDAGQPAPETAGKAADIDFERRWSAIKAGFVDDPRHSVEEADALVEEAVTSLTGRRQGLLERWKDTDEKDTEQLRLALREYRELLVQLIRK
jgi:hypothetical protein